MNRTLGIKQRGLTLSGFIFGAFILVLVGITGLKMIPAYMQNATIKGLFVTIANDPEMQGASLGPVKMSYLRRASVEDIRTITVDDIEISKDDGDLRLSASYAVKIPLVANVSLYLEFNPSSGK